MIDAYVRIAVLGIELITIDARIVIASVDTYLRFAEAVNRLDLTQTHERGIDVLREGAEAGTEKAKGEIEGPRRRTEAPPKGSRKRSGADRAIAGRS